MRERHLVALCAEGRETQQHSRPKLHFEDLNFLSPFLPRHFEVLAEHLKKDITIIKQN